MKTVRFFDPVRFWHLLKMEIFCSRKALLIAIVITLGLLKVGFLLTGIFSNSLSVDAHTANFTFLLLVGGFILSSMAFHDLSNPASKYRYLTLPASVFEKFLSMWLLTCFGWILIFSITFLIYSWFAGVLGPLLFRQMTFVPFDLFSESSITAIRYYIVLQGIFLVGAVHFRGYAFPKTIFTLIIACFICGFIFYMISSDIFRYEVDWDSSCNLFQEKNLTRFISIAHGLLLWVMPPLSWIITYTGLKEQEV
jgi:hypothetical protein